MTDTPASPGNLDLHKYQQFLKWTIYALLLVNWVYYIFEDWTRAQHALPADASLKEWAEEFATSIDELAWFVMLFMLELETYVLEDEDWTGWTARVIHGLRMLCFVMIAHTLFAYSNSMANLHKETLFEETNLCQLTDQDLSFVRNLKYTDVTEKTCESLSEETTFYKIAHYPVVTDQSGLELERQLGWADIFECLAWLLVIAAIEVVVRLQDKGVTGGALMTTLNRAKIFLYMFIFSVGVYWASLGHWVYLWDEFLWIGGFTAIEMNLSEWRDEIRDEVEA